MMGAMPAISERRIFSVGESIYTWEDVVLAAVLWGEWDGLRREVQCGLSCLKRLEDVEDEEEALPEEEVSSAAAEFRYSRDLIAAEDMEAWLEHRGLTAADWMDYIQRSLLIKKWAADLEEIQEENPVDPEEVDQVIACDAICGGCAAAWAARLADRAAVGARMSEEGRGLGPETEIAVHELRSVLEAFPAAAGDASLPGGLPSADPTRLAALARLEVAWRRFAEGQVTPQAIREQVAAHGIDWTRVSLQSVFLRDPDAAREAALCIREDGRDPAEVAAESGAELTDGTWFLDEVEPALRDHLLGARRGEVLGPLRLKDGFAVVAVRAKQPPAPEDPVVRARAEGGLLQRAVRSEVENRVRWNEPL